MRVHYSHSPAGLNVLNSHIFLKSRLASAGLSDNIKMPPPVINLNPEFYALIAEIRFREQCNIVIHKIIRLEAPLAARLFLSQAKASLAL